MSAAGEEFMKDLWRGKVPVQFTLSTDSLAGMEYERPTAFYKLIPRVGYLSFFLSEVMAHLQHAAARQHGGDTEIWLSRDVDGKVIPIRWHFPVGVVFDYLLLEEGKQTEEMLPLSLSVHFTPKPDPSMVSMSTEKEAMALFSQILKQAHTLRYNSTQAVTKLSMSQWNDLVVAVRECNYAKYATVRTQLRRAEIEPKKLPIFIHYNDHIWLRSPSNPASDSPTTLAEFLREILPDTFPFTDEETHSENPIALPNVRLLVQGVTPSPATPLIWLSEYMSHPDGFLHIVIREVKKTPSAETDEK
eukprot:TRINITY_DN18366_c0_g1_i1.p1 TRINITY_DN18366_c0_g1~~TRINITY_DN18366_c0_g1_i1.p1  ORF type:complete len:303 (+),score=70.95 TRINITY_DN18366_c0_g1_i1:72-980(+)